MIKRSIRIAGHSTSISLEAEFWAELKRIAETDNISLNALIARVDKMRSGNLSSTLRVFVLKSLSNEPLPVSSGH